MRSTTQSTGVQMPVGDCQAAFAEAAYEDGIALESYRLPWLNQRGHFGLPHEAANTLGPLEQIFEALGGNRDEQCSKNATALPGDFIHTPTRTILEVDESQHFTSRRLESLRLYPPNAPLGFDLQEYVALCGRHAARSDRYRAAKDARGFPGARGRQRQRAYYDAVRDLAAPAMGFSPVIRVPVFDDGAAAYRRIRDRLRSLFVEVAE